MFLAQYGKINGAGTEVRKRKTAIIINEIILLKIVLLTLNVSLFNGILNCVGYLMPKPSS